MECSVIIAAAGLGARFGSKTPKQFIELMGVPLIIRSLRIFDRTPEVKSIIVVANSEWRDYLENNIFRYNISKVKAIPDGGAVRQDSIWNALSVESTKSSDIILIHDAVRPLTSIELVQKVIAAAEEYGAVIPALKPKDTIKITNGKSAVIQTLNRNNLCIVQTPQGFWREILVNGYEKAKINNYYATDDAQLVEAAGYRVQIIEGEETNIKITTPLDMKFAELILNN